MFSGVPKNLIFLIKPIATGSWITLENYFNGSQTIEPSNSTIFGCSASGFPVPDLRVEIDGVPVDTAESSECSEQTGTCNFLHFSTESLQFTGIHILSCIANNSVGDPVQKNITITILRIKFYSPFSAFTHKRCLTHPSLFSIQELLFKINSIIFW